MPESRRTLPWIELAAPLLVAAWLFFPDDRRRWLAVGLIVTLAIAFTATVFSRAAVPLTIIGTIFIRWIPFPDVILWREILILGGVLLVLASMRDSSPLAIAAALAVAVVTPVVPGKAMLFPFALAAFNAAIPRRQAAGGPAGWQPAFLTLALIGGAFLVRYSFVPLFVAAIVVVGLPVIRRIPVLPHAVAIALFALWPWSGLLARSFPAFLRAEQPSHDARGIGWTLDPGQSITRDAPRGRHSATVTASAASASRLRKGALLGRIELVGQRGAVSSREVRIGDVSDFGFMRREHFFASRNPPPRYPTSDIRGRGASAWLFGSGRITIYSREEIAFVRFSAAGLPANARLQIETIEFE